MGTLLPTTELFAVSIIFAVTALINCEEMSEAVRVIVTVRRRFENALGDISVNMRPW